MRKIILYIAASIDGKIATLDGGVEWLESIANPDKTDYGYAEFYNSIDTTIMGYGTYHQIISWDIPFPYKDKENYVLTSRKKTEKYEYVEFINPDKIQMFEDIKQKPGSDIWLIGGGKTNAFFLSKGLIDELRLFIMPVVLNKGISLFSQPEKPFQSSFKLQSSNRFSNGVIENRYEIRS